MVEYELAYKSIEPRNGLGFDIEVAHSRPVAITTGEDEDFELAFFKGWVIMLPFLAIYWGEVY